MGSWLLLPLSLSVRGSAQETRPVRAELRWTRAPGADGCVDGALLQRLVQEQLGDGVLVPAEGDLVVEGRVARREGQEGYRAEVDFVQRSGEVRGHREVTVSDADCHVMDEALALVIAMTLRAQPPIEVEVPAPEPQPTAQPVPPPREASSGTPLEPEETEAPPSKTRFDDVDLVRARGAWLLRDPYLAAAGVMSLGLMPAAAMGAQVALGVRPLSWFALELTSSLFPVGSQPTNLGEVDFFAGYAEISACPGWVRGRLRMQLCAGAFAGALRGRGKGFSERNEDPVQPLGGATVAAALRVTLWSRLHANLRLAGLAPFVRDRFGVREGDAPAVSVHRVAPVFATATLGFGVDL